MALIMRGHLKLILVPVLVLLLAGTFVYLRTARKQAATQDAKMINSGGVALVRNYRQVLGSQLPPFGLAKASGEQLPEKSVREGHVVLFFLAADCRACMENGEFFKSAVSARSDVTYYGVRPYDKDSKFDELYANVVPFTVYFDVDHRLTRYLGVRGVPVIVFLKDGNIKRIWGGIAKEEPEKIEFNYWLNSF
jgi:peroxiredoxin